MNEQDRRPATSAGRLFVVPFDELEPGDLARVGGKGVNLGILTRAGLPVPPGFCVTTAAYDRWLAGADAGAAEVLRGLDGLDAEDTSAVRAAGAAVRAALESVPMPTEVADAVADALDPSGAYAVRSSATAEDLPDASFAGQQDTYLNIQGRDAVLDAVRRCWVSLFTDRAIAYRARNGFAHEAVKLSVIVQRMVEARVSGILFTADPLTGNRHIASIDAGPGLGEALVSGVSSADLYRVDRRLHRVVEARVASKSVAIRSAPGGGTVHQALTGQAATARVLTDDEAVELARVGGHIEALYGVPQDIEWSFDGAGHVHILQSRAITTLFPLPVPHPTDGALHVYVSFGHVQVMTRPVPPMARSVWRTIPPFGRPGPVAENPNFAEAAGYLFVDFTPAFALAPVRHLAPRLLPLVDKLIARGVEQVLEREEFQERLGLLDGGASPRGVASVLGPVMARAQRWIWVGDLDGVRATVEARCDAWVAEAQARIAAAPEGALRMRAAREVTGGLLGPAFQQLMPTIIGGMVARGILGKMLPAETDALNALMRGLVGNATTEMDLRVGDLADLARTDPVMRPLLEAGDIQELTRALRAAAGVGPGANPAGALGASPANGGTDAPAVGLESQAAGPPERPFRTAWRDFLELYGDRGPAEIDISSPRWREDPSSLAAVILGNYRGPEGAHRVREAELRAAGEAAADHLVAAARHGVLGPVRARVARRLTRAVRYLVPLREHPKFMLIRSLAAVRTTVLDGGATLVAEGRLGSSEEVWLLRLGELEDALAGDTRDWRALVIERKAEMARAAKRVPPRLITSDGELPEVGYTDEVPEGALAGSSASAGIVEGVARVILDPTSTTLDAGEVLVAPFTDPGWTPLFINAAALVMEVGGLMTHGSVVAREYGIPAVVGVLDATTKLKSGQRIRVNGDAGYVEILDGRAPPGEHV